MLERLRTLLREEGGLIATLIAPVGDTDRANASELASSPARVAAEGPRTEGRRDEYELLVEAIYEGYLLHYGRPRVVRAAEAGWTGSVAEARDFELVSNGCRLTAMPVAAWGP